MTSVNIHELIQTNKVLVLGILRTGHFVMRINYNIYIYINKFQCKSYSTKVKALGLR